MASAEAIRSGRVKVVVLERAEPVPAAHAAACPYRAAHHAAAAVGAYSTLCYH